MSNIATLPTQAAGGQLETQQGFSSQGLLMDFEKVRAMQALAEIMASAKVTVPAHLSGKAGDCLAVVMQAAQWGMNPFAVAQKTHVVNGTLGYEAQLVNAVVQSSGAIDGRFHYEYRNEGANVECRVGAVIRGERDITWGEWLSAASVTTKNSPLWKTNPKQQLGYLQVKNWARAHTPGAILGVYSADELEEMPIRDMGAAEVVGEPQATATSNTRTEALKNQLGAGKKKGATLEQVLEALDAATDPEGLLKAAELAKKLTADEDKKAAGDRYLSRLHELKGQTVNKGTGEIIDHDDSDLKEVETAGKQSMAVIYAQVAEKLNKAKDQDELDAAADLIQYVESASQQAELSHVYKAKANEFKQQ